MSTNDIASPNAAERYFNHSLVGQAAMLLAEMLGAFRGGNPALSRRTAKRAARRAAKQPTPDAKWLDRLDTWFWRQEQKSRDAYLAQSRDVFDLERRMEALDRGTVTPYY